MLAYLKTVFGSDITAEEYDFPKDAPYYIRDGYTAQCLLWNKIRCVILAPKASSLRLPTLKKQLRKFQEICPLPCALYLENMTALQRRNLLENNIPFVSLSQQVYLPFWGCSFIEHFKADVPVTEKMSPGTQLIFLYFYYLQNINSINLTQISRNLSLSKATCTRAVNDLAASGLITQHTEGTNKWIAPAYSKPEFLKKGYERLKSPIERYIYVKNPVHAPKQLFSGMLALAELSMVGANENDGAIALSKKDAAKIPVDEICSEQDFKDFGGYMIEVWAYDPALLADGNHVDEISLLLSMDHLSDERIQMGLDKIRKNHELPIKDEE